MPETIKRLLARLAGRERSLGFAWAAGRAVAVVLAVFLVCCAADWLLDRFGETPWPARASLLAVQCVLWLVAAAFILLPLLRSWQEDDLALRIEDKVPALGHRLISAVQLNREGAPTAGMSSELIAATTRRAEEQASAVDVAQVAPGDRYRWAMMAVLPVVALVGGLFLLMPATARALANRAFLGDAEIPRRVSLTPEVADVWPANEEGELQLAATGDTEGDEGHVMIYPDEGPPLRLPLARKEKGVWVAKVPESDIPFAYRAWLGDGRMKGYSTVRYSPRPVVQSVQAWVRLPLSLAKQADGSAYEEPQKAGDIVWRVPGSKGYLRVTTQTPIQQCMIAVRGPKGEKRHALEVSEDGKVATGEIPLRVENGGYEVLLECPHGFKNTERVRRGVRRGPLEPPEVVLLPETVYRAGDTGSPDEREVEGIPVVEGERFRLDYRASSRYGLDRAQVRFRVVPLSRGDEGRDRIDPDKFLPLSLGPPKGAKKPTATALKEFHTSKADPDSLPDSAGGGQYNFEIAGIPDGMGGRTRLSKGDRILFYVEVYGKADPNGKPGRSVIREKEVVDIAALLTWLERKEDLKERTRLLEETARTTRPGSSR